MYKALVDEKKKKKPVENVFFYVDPGAMNRSFFSIEREDPKQERTRMIILEAFDEVKKNPEKYASKFKTVMLERKWQFKTVGEMKSLAEKLGGHISNWVEQALEWAQRINNGEGWEEICNEPDTAKWYRVVVWKSGNARLIGGAANLHFDSPATDISRYEYIDSDKMYTSVPTITIKI